MECRRRILVAVCLLVAALCPRVDLAAEYKWLSSPTRESSPELVSLQQQLVTPRLAGVKGIRVADAQFEEGPFVVKLTSGTLYLEPPVAGAPCLAFFTGKASVSFESGSPAVHDDLAPWFEGGQLHDEPVTDLLFFTLAGKNLAEQLTLTTEPSAAPLESAEYALQKAALGQLGLKPLRALLDRDGRTAGTTFVVFAAPGKRVSRSKTALLMYSADPRDEQTRSLWVTGHQAVTERNPQRWFWHRLTGVRDAQHPLEAQARVDEYRVQLKAGEGAQATESAQVSFHVDRSTAALQFDFTSRLNVRAVTGPSGEPLPFVQWKHLATDPNYDETLVVKLRAPLEPGAAGQITVASDGELFEPVGSAHYLAEEDTWLPLLDDAGGTTYDTTLTVPNGHVGIAPGRLLEASQEQFKDAVFHYRTTRLQHRATIYYGEFVTAEGDADGIRIKLYGDSHRQDVRKNLDFIRTEIENMVKVYDKLYGKLDVPEVRVIGTPTMWGRGFDSLILLGSRGGFDSQFSNSDLFRAHEVAHQWWGNVVFERHWPEDRWLSEAFAQYSALFYYRVRYDDAARERAIVAEWARPSIEAPEFTQGSLSGSSSRFRPGAAALTDGGSNVYDKGPAVLHMLRYVFKLVRGNDEAFWTMLREFLAAHAGRPVCTGDFAAHVSKSLGSDMSWFFRQWVEGYEIPDVQWHYSVTRKGDKWALHVEAAQPWSHFMLSIPVYIHLPDKKVAMRPLALRGWNGELNLELPEKPEKITLNDNFEALVRLTEKE